MSLRKLLDDPAYQSLSVAERKQLLRRLQQEYEAALREQSTQLAVQVQHQLKRIALGAAIGLVVIGTLRWLLGARQQSRPIKPANLNQQATALSQGHHTGFWSMLQQQAQRALSQWVVDTLTHQLRILAENKFKNQVYSRGSDSTTDS